MKKFSRRRGLITTELSGYEVELLSSLINQLVELVSEGEPEKYASDAGPEDFNELVRELEVDQPEEPSDPVLKRLFPNAYPGDAAAASDFRRFTERGPARQEDQRGQDRAEAASRN